MDNQLHMEEKEADAAQPPPPASRLMASVILGAAAGVFIAILAMAVAMLVMSVIKLALPDVQLKVAGLSITAVTFVIFCALGWVSASIYFWYKLSTSTPKT